MWKMANWSAVQIIIGKWHGGDNDGEAFAEAEDAADDAGVGDDDLWVDLNGKKWILYFLLKFQSHDMDQQSEEVTADHFLRQLILPHRTKINQHLPFSGNFSNQQFSTPKENTKQNLQFFSVFLLLCCFLGKYCRFG